MARKHPPWIKVKVSSNQEFVRMQQLVRTHQLHTVCESASCPNIGECWGRGTATFMILGGTCTRNCRFCDVRPGDPEPIDHEEPRRVAEAIHVLGLHHAVITSVTRDDLTDGGASAWADTIHQIRALNAECRVEVLIPDLQGRQEALLTIFQEKPDIIGHNLETVSRLYPTARPQADYKQSLAVLRFAKEHGLLTKSGIMLGMGETYQEIATVMDDLRHVKCDILTVGQYLQPTAHHLPVVRYWTPEEFQQLAAEGEQRGFMHVEAGPLVRSSYHADALTISAHSSI